MAESTFQLAVVTPERTILEAEARSVVLPAYDGALGVLAHRAPMLARLGSGELRAELAEGGTEEWFVEGGFAQMAENRLTILTERAERIQDLNREQAQWDLEEALAKQIGDAFSPADRDRAVVSARARLRLAP